jgi:predicted lipoprotein with Yx(FWY)xxD motif
MTFPGLAVAALSLTALALIIGGCGSSSNGYSSSSSQSSTSSSNGSMTVAAASGSKLGTVIVDSEGFTVYAFDKDKGTTPSCYGACAEAWTPVTTEGAPTAGEGATTSELGTTKRKDGTVQVTYAGHPLYTFIEDQSPGDANGNGVTEFGGEWHALSTSGTAISTSAGAGSRYGY